MAQFTTIVPGRIWQVNDLLPTEQADEILAVDWSTLPWVKGDKQENWLRRQIPWNDPTARRLSRYITEQLPAINQATGNTFKQASGIFWVDQPGFTVDMHTDGHLLNSLQMYWIAPGPEYGTGFYHYKNKESLLYQFESRANTGYIMLNHLNDDGSQPLQWHGMFNPVPANTIRVSSYWQFS